MTNLILSNNNIKEFRSIINLKNLKNLEFLLIDNNPITNEEDFFYKIINMLPKLKVLNFHKIKLKEKNKSLDSKYKIELPNLDLSLLSKREKVKILLSKVKNEEEISKFEFLIKLGQFDNLLDAKLKEYLI